MNLWWGVEGPSVWGTKKISQAPRCVRFSHVKPQLASRIASEESSIYIFKHQSPTFHPILGQINMVSPHLSTAIKHIKSTTRLSTTSTSIRTSPCPYLRAHYP